MLVVNIISGILLVAASLAIIGVVIITDTRNSGINSAISGSSDTFFGKNSANTKEAKIDKITKICVIVFFVITLIVNIVISIFG